MDPSATLLEDGKRLHLHHGPIDLIIGADGDQKRAFAAATARFETVLTDLMGEIDTLRAPTTAQSVTPKGAVARRMVTAVSPYHADGLVTPMAAVAGSVADDILRAMCDAADLQRAYVNNGGDIAVHLGPDARFRMAMAAHDGRDLGRIDISHDDPVRGIATSGRHGRSLSLGIADSVTVLARSAAQADVAATLIANHVDLPGHPAISRRAAWDVVDDSDLCDTPVVTACAPLPAQDADTALRAGLRFAETCVQRGLIHGAALFLGTQSCATPLPNFQTTQRMPHYA